jgi:hypothetical protein
MTSICGRLSSERTITGSEWPAPLKQEHPASEFALGGSIRILLLAYECHVKTKFHVAGKSYVPSPMQIVSLLK